MSCKAHDWKTKKVAVVKMRNCQGVNTYFLWGKKEREIHFCDVVEQWSPTWRLLCQRKSSLARMALNVPLRKP